MFDQSAGTRPSWSNAGAAPWYHLTLYDQSGNVTQRYDVGPSDIVSDDPIHQDISFRVGGQVQHFHGSYQKNPY